MAAAETTLGRLDVLVNSAGVREIVGALDLSFEEWNQMPSHDIPGNDAMVAPAAVARAVVSFFVFTRAVIAASSKKMQAQAFETLLVAREP